MREKILIVVEDGVVVQVRATADIKILIADLDSVSSGLARAKLKAKLEGSAAIKAFPIECELYEYK